MGSEGASTTWFFAEGCSRDGFDTWLCLQNPTGEAAVCDIRYYCGDGAVEARPGITLEPHSRATIPVHEPGLGPGRANNPHGDFSIAVFSTNGVPIVAERPMYFRYRSSQPEWRCVDRDQLVLSLGLAEIFNGDTSLRRIALTFDAEGDRAATVAILDALKACDAHCTFFVLGTFADSNLDLVRRMADEGHEVASHSYDHREFTGISAQKRYEEIVTSGVAISRITGYSPRPTSASPTGPAMPPPSPSSTPWATSASTGTSTPMTTPAYPRAPSTRTLWPGLDPGPSWSCMRSVPLRRRQPCPLSSATCAPPASSR
ncbi:MAG: polysaccharide deacetylase family protein [Actinomycetota bacterium]